MYLTTTKKKLPSTIDNVLSSVNGGGQVADEIIRLFSEEPDLATIIDNPVLTPQTYGDWNLSYNEKEDYRPSDSISWQAIDRMMRSGPVLFAIEMKRAEIFRVFSEGRYKVSSPDAELAEITQAALDLIITKFADDVTHSMMVEGAYFGEMTFSQKSRYELGMSNSAGAKTKFWVPDVPAHLHGKTVDHIMRDSVTHSFRGFVQKPDRGAQKIEVGIGSALVIPLNSHYRNFWGRSLLTAAYPFWVWYEVTMRVMSRYLDRMATPVTVAKAPSKGNVTLSDESTPVRPLKLALYLAASIAKSNAVAIPSDTDENGKPMWELDYLVAQDRSQPFIAVLEHLSQEILRSILTADRATTQPSVASGGVGSNAIGQVHSAASSVTSEMILLQILFYMNKYFLPWISKHNRGDNGPPLRLRAQPISNKEYALLQSLISVAANSPASQEFFQMIDWRTLGETSSIPLLTDKQLQETKDRLAKEAQDKAMDQQKVFEQSANNKEKDTQTPEKKVPEDKKELEDDYPAIVDKLLSKEGGFLFASVDDLNRLMDGNVLRLEESIKLFNPFHEGSTGRFASKQGGGGGTSSGGKEGGSTSGGATPQRKSKLGSILKTSGKVLGLTGLGVVGLAILGAGNSSSGLDNYIAEKEQRKEELQQRLEELTKDWPKGMTPEQASQRALSDLRSLGFDVPDGIAVTIGQTPPGTGGFYDPNLNQMTINPDLADGIAAGDPFSMWVMTHEMAHAGQEFAGANENWGNNDEATGDDWNNRFSQSLEGQNDLAAAMAMSKMYGKPMSNDEAARMSIGGQELRNEIKGLSSGATLLSGGGEIISVGYQDDAKTWAAIATAGAQKTGETPTQFLARTHSFGFSPNESHQVLVDLFPDEMSSSGYIKQVDSSRVERRFPTQRELRQWMSNHGYTSPDLAYDQMIAEAARG